MVVRRVASAGRSPSRSFAPRSRALHRRFRLQLGGLLGRQSPVQLVVSPMLPIFEQPSGAPCRSLCRSRVSASSVRLLRFSLCGQHRSVIHSQGGRYSLRNSQCGGSVNLEALRDSSNSAGSSVHSGSPHRPCRFAQPQSPSLGFGVDPLPQCLSRGPQEVACDHRSLRDEPQSSSSRIFLPMSDPQLAGTDAMMQSWDGLQAYAFPPFGLLHRVLSKVWQSRGLELTLVALFWPQHLWFLDLLELLVEIPFFLPLRKDLLRQPHFHRFHQNLPVHRLTAYRLSSNRRNISASLRQWLVSLPSAADPPRVNYQAKWTIYREWCRRHGHSVSHPSISKVVDFLLYLRRSLSLSYSSITSYRTMLIGVFRFVLPELSSHFVLHDLLRSLRLERPSPSSRVPPWDLLVVLESLRGPLFETLSSASLRDLTRKVLFLVSLATAHRVGELQAVSSSMFRFGDDLFLSYLPEFRANSESSARPLPRSFRVRSLRDFVGSLPDKLLLCPVRALQVYLSRTSSLTSRPRSCFVSPRNPSRPLSKNALSFFIQSVISSASSSAPSSSRPPTSSSFSSLHSFRASSFRAHSVRGMAASWAFAHNAPFLQSSRLPR